MDVGLSNSVCISKRFDHLYERLSHFGLPEHVPKFKNNLHLCMCQQGQAATHLLSTPGTDVNAQLERALEYTGMFTLHAELKDRISYGRWMAAVSNFEIPNDSPEIQQRPPRVLEYIKNGFQTDVYEYDEVYGMLAHFGFAVHINELKHRISFRMNYLETHPQWAEVVETSPISTLEVLRYNGLHELLKCLESHIAFNNACGRRDVPIQPRKCRRLETSREFRDIGTVTSPLPLNRMIGAFNLLSFHGPYPSNPRPSALVLVAPHTAGDHGEHAAAGGVQLATVRTKPAAAYGNIRKSLHSSIS